MSELAWGESVRELQEGFSLTFHFWSMNTPIWDEMVVKHGLWTHHQLRYDSFLTITDGQLDTRCFGCGDWDSTPGHATGGWCTGFYSL